MTHSSNDDKNAALLDRRTFFIGTASALALGTTACGGGGSGGGFSPIGRATAQQPPQQTPGATPGAVAGVDTPDTAASEPTTTAPEARKIKRRRLRNGHRGSGTGSLRPCWETHRWRQRSRRVSRRGGVGPGRFHDRGVGLLDATAVNACTFDFGSNDVTYMRIIPRDNKNQLRFSATRNQFWNEESVSASALPTARWAHVAVTLAGTVGTLYVDGSQVATENGIWIIPFSWAGPRRPGWAAPNTAAIRSSRAECRTSASTAVRRTWPSLRTPLAERRWAVALPGQP